MKKTTVIALLMACISLAAFQKKEPLLNVPKGWPAPAYDFKKNPLSEQKILLGRMLFYDPILSKDSTISCSSCHLQQTAFTHVDHDLSHGIAGRIGTRNSPALMNLAWGSRFMWDGAVNHLDVQSLAPISNPLEMDEDIAHVVKKLQGKDIYRQMFERAYGDTGITGERTLKALSQFMLTLQSTNARYDKVMRGEDSFSISEANGYRLFQQHCNTCHTAPLFTNNEFACNGLPVDETLNDAGRVKISKQADDSLKFKVPTLRNIAYTYPYMHDGRFKTLSQVLNHYIYGIEQSASLHPALRNGIYLSSTQKAELIAFLLTLSDKDFVSNPKYGYPKEIFQPAEGLGKR